MSVPEWLVARPIAHRGLHDRLRGIVENTPSAAEAAIRRGFAIECDVQITKDGEAVVFHDHDLERLTEGSGAVRDQTLAALQAVALRSTQDRILTLREFLNGIGGRTPVVVEIKSRFDGDERLARRTVAVVRGRPEPIAVKSFDPAIVSVLRQEAPSLPRGIVAQSRYDESEAARFDDRDLRALTELLHWNDTEPDFLSWRSVDLPSGPPFLARRLGGIPVMTWTIRDAFEAARALRHADQIVFEGFDPT